MTTSTTTTEEYQKLLDAHDWWYMMSDDHRVYTKGENERKRLLALTLANEELGKMFDERLKKETGQC